MMTTSNRKNLLRHAIPAVAVSIGLVMIDACAGGPVKTAGSQPAAATPTATPKPVPGVVFGRLALPASLVASGGGNIVAFRPAAIVSTGGSNIVAQGGGNIVAQGGGNIVSTGGSNIVAQGGGNIVPQGGGNIVAQGGGNIVAQGGGNIVAQGGGNIVSTGGSNIVAQGGGNIVAQGGGNIVAQGGGNFVLAGTSHIVSTGGSNIVAQGGGNIVASGGGNIVSTGGSNIVAQGGGNIVAQGGGNIVAQGGGNYRRLAHLLDVATTNQVSNDVIDALHITQSALLDPLVDPNAAHPIANAAVELTDADGHRLPGTPIAVTNAAGYYYFIGLPSDKPYVVTCPFVPSPAIVAQGGGNIVAQGGGNIVAQGGGNIVAQGGGNIVAQGGGNFFLLSDPQASGGANPGTNPPAGTGNPSGGPTLDDMVSKTSPKDMTTPNLGSTLQSGLDLNALEQAVNRIIAGQESSTDRKADITLATTFTSNLLLAGQQGDLQNFDADRFDAVVNRISDALQPTQLSVLAKPLPEVPKEVSLDKLELPKDSDKTFKSRDEELAALQAQEDALRTKLANAPDDEKKDIEDQLAALEAQAKAANDAKVAALFDLIGKLKNSLDIAATTDGGPKQDPNGANGVPTSNPNQPTSAPTNAPTSAPTNAPTAGPTDTPTAEGTFIPADLTNPEGLPVAATSTPDQGATGPVGVQVRSGAVVDTASTTTLH